MTIKKYATGHYFLLIIIISLITKACNSGEREFTRIPADLLYDKIKGGLTGQMLGNLNGLPYEFKFVDEPGNVENYRPGLPDGARTDDDTDIEWVTICKMQETGKLFLESNEIVSAWKDHINFKIWASNLTARQLMELGFKPNETGNAVLNPWAEVNLAGQFCCESFALAAPAMPYAAEKIGLYYTRVVIDGEPAQAAQFFSAMISEAFKTDDLEQILSSGIDALDEKSETYRAVGDVLKWCDAYPDDWKETRRKIKEKYHTAGGKLPINNSGVNLSAILAAYIYGDGDFTGSLQLAFNMGWDADCNAATLGTILGVIKGYRWMEKQGWEIRDRYWNTTRPGMPEDETISGYTQRIFDMAEINIVQNGGRVKSGLWGKQFHIPYRPSESLHSPLDYDGKYGALLEKYSAYITETFGNETATPDELAKAGYLAVVFNMYDSLQLSNPGNYQRFLDAMHELPMVMHTFFRLPDFIASGLKSRMAEAGLREVEMEPQLKGNTEFLLRGYEEADRVFVGGTFNNWEAWMTPLKRTSEGWLCRLDLGHGEYAYKFVVQEGENSTWVFDPDNPRREMNHEGYENSVLVVD